jgi:hypothetical protein
MESKKLWAQRLVEPRDGGSDSSLDPHMPTPNTWVSLKKWGYHPIFSHSLEKKIQVKLKKTLIYQ